MKHKINIVRTISFFGFGGLCLLSVIVGGYGFVMQYQNVAVTQQSDTIQLAMQYRGMETHNAEAGKFSSKFPSKFLSHNISFNHTQSQ